MPRIPCEAEQQIIKDSLFFSTPLFKCLDLHAYAKISDGRLLLNGNVPLSLLSTHSCNPIVLGRTFVMAVTPPAATHAAIPNCAKESSPSYKGEPPSTLRFSTGFHFRCDAVCGNAAMTSRL